MAAYWGTVRALLKADRGIMLGTNSSEGRTELKPGVCGEGLMRATNVLLDGECPEKREWRMFCSCDLLTDSGT